MQNQEQLKPQEERNEEDRSKASCRVGGSSDEELASLQLGSVTRLTACMHGGLACGSNGFRESTRSHRSRRGVVRHSGRRPPRHASQRRHAGGNHRRKVSAWRLHLAHLHTGGKACAARARHVSCPHTHMVVREISNKASRTARGQRLASDKRASPQRVPGISCLQPCHRVLVSGAGVLRVHPVLCGQDAAGARVLGPVAQQGEQIGSWPAKETLHGSLMHPRSAWLHGGNVHFWVHALACRRGPINSTMRYTWSARVMATASCGSSHNGSPCKSPMGRDCSTESVCFRCALVQSMSVVGILSDETDPMVSVMKVSVAQLHVAPVAAPAGA